MEGNGGFNENMAGLQAMEDLEELVGKGETNADNVLRSLVLRGWLKGYGRGLHTGIDLGSVKYREAFVQALQKRLGGIQG